MKQTVTTGEKVLLFLFATLAITAFSACSFLYPYNPWDDADVYMTIGKAMLAGKELYLDIFDHKGPVLFFLHEGAAMLSSLLSGSVRTSFLGIYILEVACAFFYLLYSLRTMRLFSSSSACLPLVCLLGVMTYSSDFFGYGDSVEEFVLPLLAQSLYFMLRFVEERHVPRWWQSLIMGMGIASIFWMKFNLLFFYLGGILALAYIASKHRTWQQLWNVMLWAFTGFAAVTACVLLYFAFHGTLPALWDAYFMVNIFHYHGTATNGEPPFWWFPLVKLGIWALLMIPAAFLPVSKEVKILIFGTYGVLVLSYATLTVQFYYFLTLYAFFPLLISYIREYRLTRRMSATILLVGALCTATNWNLVTRLNGSFPHCVPEMADIVNRNETPDSEVLTFSSYDTGIYLQTRHLPPNRNFFISSILSPDIKAEQAEMVASGRIKYLAREIGAINTCHEYYDAPIPANYHLIYDQEELFRYRLIWQPLSFLWNLTWPRPLLRYIMEPVTVNQRMQLYERQP